jgi:hypothetical protein
MRTIDLNHLISQSLRSQGGFFRPTGYRFLLYLLGVDRIELDEFYRHQFQLLMGDVQSTIALLPESAERTLLGPDDDPIRRGIVRMTKVAKGITGNVKLDPSQLGTKAILLDIFDDAITRNLQEFLALTAAAGKSLTGMPERLQKNRSLAEEAMQGFCLGSSTESLDLVSIAKQRLEEVLEQPIGQRDGYAWLLSGWINFCRDGYRDAAQSDFIQASLIGGKTQNAIFIEANRMLAWLQYTGGHFEAAYQTIQKVLMVTTSQEVKVDALRYAVMAGRDQDAVALFTDAISTHPIALLAILSEQDLLARCGGLLGAGKTAMARLVSNARNDLNAWGKTIDHLTEILEQVGSSRQIPTNVVTRFDNLSQSLEDTDIFHAWWVSGESKRGKEQVESEVLKSLHIEAAERRSYLAQIQTGIDQLNDWKRTAKDRAYAMKSVKEQYTRKSLNLLEDADRVAHRTMTFFGLGFSGFCIYFGLCMFVPALGENVGPSSPNGKWVMLLLMLPMVIGFMVSVTDGMKRMAAESDFEREVRTLNGEQEAAINEVDLKYKEQLAPLQEMLNDARDAVSSIEAAIQKVHGKPSSDSSTLAA